MIAPDRGRANRTGVDPVGAGNGCQPRLVVTTSLKASADRERHAITKAGEWGLPFVSRNKRGIGALIDGGGAALVFSNTDMHIATAETQLRFHLGTAFIRLKSLSRGEGDPLVRAGELAPGDHVVDTTFGLGRDATVAAHAIGATGRITAVESSKALFHLANEAMASAEPPSAAAPIALQRNGALEFLTEQPDSSADVVLVDPMFTTPKNSDAGFTILRELADTTPLSQEWIQQARRITRRWVVVKTGASLPWFGEESLDHLPGHSNAQWFRAPPTPSPNP